MVKSKIKENKREKDNNIKNKKQKQGMKNNYVKKLKKENSSQCYALLCNLSLSKLSAY